MNDVFASKLIQEIAETIDIPQSAYDKAESRYEDLGKWFGSAEAYCSRFKPHVYTQGSFRLGTVIRPIDPTSEYDLDMGCRLESGITKASHSQKQLKELVGRDIEQYRIARGIKEAKEEKHRCWRLKYADTLRFHLDTVPSIPESAERRRQISESVMREGASLDLAKLVADLTGAITDNRMANYSILDSNWRLSNSEGFARWFESRMKLAKTLMVERASIERKATIDDLPAYRWKSPLQRSVQLLKRHRDAMFVNNPDSKPASIIITTLAARAYQGEVDIAVALQGILTKMGTLVRPNAPRVPNPVNPAEDFADRWVDPSLNLEANFWRWLRQAQNDFAAIGKEKKVELIVENSKKNFAVNLSSAELVKKFGTPSGEGLLKTAAIPAGLSFPSKPLIPSKPAGFA